MTPLEIRALAPENVDELLAFFDRDAFADNTWWSGCYCYFYHSPGDEWDAGSDKAAEHREAKRRHALAGRSHGFLAYAGGKVVGWLNAAPRESYENPRGFGEARDGTPGVGALMCFVVAPGHRRRGVARALLRAACDGFKRASLRYAEGYARVAPKRDDWETFDTMSYHGPLALYEAEGFTRIRDLGAYAIMRKTL
ncbi:hypothetical protein BH18CHL2_BH18CHL2_04540 [soil metagenome]